MRARTRILLVPILVGAGCGSRAPAIAPPEVGTHAAAATAVPGPAPHASLEETSTARLTIAPLEIIPVGWPAPVLTLKTDGRVTFVDKPLGTLGGDGRFTFAADERVVATLNDNGALWVTGPQDIPKDLPGSLARNLRSFEGRIESAFVMDARGDARGGGSVLRLLPEGKTSDGRLVVVGLTPSTRRTAMYLIVLLTIIID